MNTEATAGRMTLVVGMDTSPESDAALAWARETAPADARIVLVNVWEVPLVTGYDVVVPIDPHDVEELAINGLNERIEQEDDERLEGIVRNGHPGRALVHVADEVGADMIVVGHRGHGRVSMVLGSTANYVLHHSERPSIVVRGDHHRPPRRVVVGVDDHDIDADAHGGLGENESVRAVRFACGLPGVEEVKVVHAWFLPALAVGMYTPMTADIDEMDAAAVAVADRVVAAAGDPPPDVKVLTEAVRGTGAFGLIEASRETDMVIVGTRGRGGFTGLVLGSTSSAVAAHSHAPVAVVR